MRRGANQLLGLRVGGEDRSHIKIADGDFDGEGRPATKLPEGNLSCRRIPHPPQIGILQPRKLCLAASPTLRDNLPQSFEIFYIECYNKTLNAIIKKQNGIVFTPEWVADFMIDEVLNNQKINGDEKILDAGCGEGVFAAIAAQKFSKLSGKKIEKVIEDNIFLLIYQRNT